MDEDDECTIRVKRHMYEWAISHSGRTAAELAGLAGLENLESWMAGTADPTYDQAEKFSHETYTPFGYLLLSEPPEAVVSVVPHHAGRPRGGDCGRSRHFEDLMWVLDDRQEWAHGYTAQCGIAAHDFVGSAKVGDDPAAVAESIRGTLGLEGNGLHHMLERANSAGIFASLDYMMPRRPDRVFNPEEFRGVALADGRAPLVFVNASDSIAPELSLAHGLAHIWFGASASYDLYRLGPADNDVDRACHKVASELLVPANEVHERWNRLGWLREPYAAAGRDLGVGPLVAARLALDAGRTDADAFNAAYDRLAGRNGREVEPPDPEVRVGGRLLRMVFSAVGHGLLHTDAYDLTGLDGKTFDRLRETVR